MGQRERDWKQEIAGLDDAQLLDRWRAAIDSISQQMIDVRLRRLLFAELDDELVRRHKGEATDLVVGRWLRPLYGDAQLAALRRITADDDVRSVSLTVLIEEIKLRPEIVSRRHYLALAAAMYADSPEFLDFANADFDRIVGPGNDHIPAELLTRYSEAIAGDYERVKEFTDKHVAHSDRVGVPAITWGELDKALDDLEEHLNRIRVPLTGGYLSDDATLGTDWRVAFRGLFDDDPDASA